MLNPHFFSAVALLSAGALLLSSCSELVGSDPPEETQPDFQDARGTIGRIDASVSESKARLVVYPESEPGNRYCLEGGALPEKLRRAGVAVRFTGNREEIPPNVRLPCLPLELIEIEGAAQRANEKISPVTIDSEIEPGEYPDDGYRIVEVVGTDTLADARPEFPTVKVGTLRTDTLALRVQYSGGCEEHEFELVAEDSFMESSPVQAGVRLFHDGNGDMCEALPTETIRFDLTPLRERHQEMYGVDSSVMLLRFYLAEERRLLVRYEF